MAHRSRSGCPPVSNDDVSGTGNGLRENHRKSLRVALCEAV